MLASYWLAIVPRARRALRGWEAWAGAIADPVLRDRALATLHQEAMNSEAAAVFAVLVPRPVRATVIRLLVAFQVMFDYLDTVGEEPVPHPLMNGLQLHRALVAALDPSGPDLDYYAYHPQRDDDGYLARLVAVCRDSLRTLPAAAAIEPTARRAARRCGEAQSHTHATLWEGATRLVAWSSRQDRAEGYLWWEVAAGGISSVGIHALLVAAADPRTTHADAMAIDAAYFPPMCSLSTLLDSLVDRDRDDVTGDHSFVAHYPTQAATAERLAAIAAAGDAAARRLRHGRRHAVILAGIAGYYLSDAGADTDYARPITQAVLDQLGSAVPLILATVRLRRWLKGRDAQAS